MTTSGSNVGYEPKKAFTPGDTPVAGEWPYTQRPCVYRRGFVLGKEGAGIVHTEELTINQIFPSLFVLFTQADAIQKNKLAAAII